MSTASTVDPDRLTDLMDRARREVEAGTIPACQLAVALDGEVVAEATFGAPEGSRFHGYSSGKAVVAGAVWLLLGEGALALDDRVADHIPEFGTNDKDRITLEQVLLHTSGFPRAPFATLDWNDRDVRLARFSSWRTNWEPGTRFEYHATSAHWVLVELIERVTGQDWRQFLVERLLDPLGLERPPLRRGPRGPGRHRRRGHRRRGPHRRADLEALTGIAGLDLAAFQGEVTDEMLLTFNRPEVRAVGSPGGGADHHRRRPGPLVPGPPPRPEGPVGPRHPGRRHRPRPLHLPGPDDLGPGQPSRSA